MIDLTVITKDFCWVMFHDTFSSKNVKYLLIDLMKMIGMQISLDT